MIRNALAYSRKKVSPKFSQNEEPYMSEDKKKFKRTMLTSHKDLKGNYVSYLIVLLVDNNI